MISGLGHLPFSPIENTGKGFIEQLISGIRQHHFTQKRHEGHCHQGCDLHDDRSHVFQAVPQRPARLAILIGRGHGDDARVIEDFVELVLIQPLPWITLNRVRVESQLGVVDGRASPGRPRVTRLYCMPGLGIQVLVERGKKITALLMGDEPGKKPLVGR